MVYYKKAAKEKVIHVGWCTHVRRMQYGTVGKFRSVAEAYARGYRICRCCESEMRTYEAMPVPKAKPVPQGAFIPTYAEQIAMTF